MRAAGPRPRRPSAATASMSSGLIRKARHIEVQIVGDRYGAISHLWERECTIQRRHQKLIEVAPSPSLSDGLRTRIVEAARQLAAAAHYDSLGTFEFLVDGETTGDATSVRLHRGQPAASGRAHRDRRGARHRSGEVAAGRRRRRHAGRAGIDARPTCPRRAAMRCSCASTWRPWTRPARRSRPAAR